MARSPRIKSKKTETGIDDKKMVYAVTIGIFLVFLIILNYFSMTKMLNTNNTDIANFTKPKTDKSQREPAVAGVFYSADRKQLDEDIKHYLKYADVKNIERPKILIVPHAGYKYSGAVAAKAYATLKPFADDIKRVVIIGPSHYEPLKGGALPSVDSFVTPLGKVGIDKNIVKQLTEQYPFIRVLDKTHMKEHSIEVQLPFLQKALNDFTIVPIAYGSVDPEQLAQALKPFLQMPDTIVIFSADLSHYYQYDHAKELDEHTANLILGNDADISQEYSCGAVGINAALMLSKEHNFYPQTLDLKNSGDVTGDRSSVVGYGAWSFSENKINEPVGIQKEFNNLQDFANMYKDSLREIVQISLEDAVDEKHFKPSRSDYELSLFDKGASFVTLIRNGELRGCVGTIVSKEAVALDIANATYGAAMQDKRFSKIAKEEISELDYYISLLTNLERIRFLNEDDLLAKIEQGKDGLLIVDGNRHGVFLPSVWKEISDKKEFLQQLKIKAGLSPTYWSGKIMVYRFWTVEIKKDEN